MDIRSRNIQWVQLAVLSSTHFLADMFGGLMPPILPVIRKTFSLSLATGAGLLFVFYFVHNGIQVLIGHSRAKKDKPLFLQTGIALSALVCLLGMFGNFHYVYLLLLLLVFVSGSGIGMTHTEGLRGMHALEHLPPTLSTSFYMTGGYLGTAFGQFFAAFLVENLGLKGLYFLLIGPVIVIVLVYIFKIRLAIESQHQQTSEIKPAEQYSFWPVAIMGVPSAIGTFLFAWYLPTRLNELGFSITFGGLCAMAFAFSGAIGTFSWGVFAHKRRMLTCSIYAFLAGAVAALVYLFFLSSWNAIFLLFIVGFCVSGGYVLIVTMARMAKELKIGQRVGIIVGGTWAVAGVFALIGVELISLPVLLYFTPLCYLISAVIGLYIMRKTQTDTSS